jgi:hypothetical protein
MSTAEIRQKLHNYLESADDKVIKAMFTIMEKDIENNALVYTSTLKSELNNRQKDYLDNKVQLVNQEDSKRRIRQILNENK